MKVGLFDEKRGKVLDLLPLFWAEGFTDNESATIIASTDKQAIKMLKRKKLYTSEIKMILE